MTAAPYVVARDRSPKRDVDLFGPTTVRLDRGGVPVLYLSAYVEDAERLAQRLIAALAWLDDTQASQARAEEGRGDAAPASVLPAYQMPSFVEDVDYAETLTLADDIMATDWKAWASAIVRRIELATTAHQIAALQDANAVGFKVCPNRFRVTVGKALNDAWLITQDQAAAA